VRPAYRPIIGKTAFTLALILVNAPRRMLIWPRLSSPAKAGDPVFQRRQRWNREAAGYWIPPLEPVIGLAEGETRWRSMTTVCEGMRARRALNRLSAPG
jgi:hypothetical protein